MSVSPNTVIRIVDDDESVRKALSFLLRSEGFAVQVYSCAQDFLRDDAPSVPGCVILDIRMPGMTGLELFAELRRRSYTRPILFLTAHGDIEMAVRAVKEGAFDFIQKPIDPEKFLASVSNSLLTESGPVSSDSLQARSRMQRLTKRETQILSLVLEGMSNREIGDRLGLSERTIENHRAASYKKLEINTSDQLRELGPLFREFMSHRIAS